MSDKIVTFAALFGAFAAVIIVFVVWANHDLREKNTQRTSDVQGETTHFVVDASAAEQPTRRNMMNGDDIDPERKAIWLRRCELAPDCLAKLFLDLESAKKGWANIRLVSIKTALWAGAEVNGSGQYFAPLHFAALGGNAEAISFLIKAGANVDAKSDEELTALHIAAIESSPEAVLALLAAGAAVNAKDKVDWTPLDYANRVLITTALESPPAWAVRAALLDKNAECSKYCKHDRKAHLEAETRRKAEAAEERRRIQAEREVRRQAEEEAKRREAQIAAKARPWIDWIGRRIKDNLHTPSGTAAYANVRMVVRIHPNGELAADPQIASQSDFPDFDEAAVQAVLNSAPLPMPLDDAELHAALSELTLNIRPPQYAAWRADLRERFISRIGRRIERNLRIPPGTAAAAEVRMIVRLHPDGELAADPQIVSASGFADYDEEAVRAVLKSTPMPVPRAAPELLAEFSVLTLNIRPPQ